jgi:hypothetical protein
MALKDILEGAVGTLIAGGGYWVARSTLIYAKSRDKELDEDGVVKNKIAEAVEDATMKSDIAWIKAQLGPNPNSGGAMEQVLKIINRIDASLTEHLKWHDEPKPLRKRA